MMNGKNKKVNDRKQKFDAIMSKIINYDLPLENLLAAQLKILCAIIRKEILILSPYPSSNERSFFSCTC